MGDWQAVGEVPDSEEEEGSFGSPYRNNILSPIATTSKQHGWKRSARNGPSNTSRAEGDDPWNIPDSPQTSPSRQRLTLTSLPQSPAPRSTSPAPLSSPLSSARSDIESLTNRTPVSTSPSHDIAFDSAPPSQEHQGEEQSTAVRYELHGIGTASLANHTTPDPPDSLEMHQVLRHQVDERFARQLGGNYERTLRPRRPIQEHPYLLENAHYSSILKRHGIKPVRALIETERERKGRESTWMDDDPGAGRRDGLDPPVTEDSQSNQASQPLAEDDVWSMPPSPASGTSPMTKDQMYSSQTSTRDGTDVTSVFGQDLPSLEDLMKQSPRNLGLSVKRHVAKNPGPKRRRRDIVESDPVEIPQSIVTRFPESPDPLLAPFASSPPEFPSPIRREVHKAAVPALFGDEASSAMAIDSELGDIDRPTSPTSKPVLPVVSDPEQSSSELVNTVGRRIKGVLPASWLRLDQLSAHDKTRSRINKHQRILSPDREQRRGIAQRRQVPFGTAVDSVLFEESDESPSPPRVTLNAQSPTQTRLPPTLLSRGNSFPQIHDISDDGTSAQEDNTIDTMLPARKRQLQLPDSLGLGVKRHKAASTGNGEGQGFLRRPKITDLASGLTSGSTSHNERKPGKRCSSTNRKPASQTVNRIRAPRLGVLDVIEDKAPTFLRIAARTAKQRPDQGRANPRRKRIRLATRQDNVDAVGVLRDWMQGSIRPRHSVSNTARNFYRPGPLTLQPDGNRINGPDPVLPDQPLESPSHTVRTQSKLVDLDKPVASGSQMNTETLPTKEAHTRLTARPEPTRVDARPAQLETGDAQQASKQTFHTRKRWLDRLYRANSQNGSVTGAATEDRLEPDLDNKAKAVTYGRHHLGTNDGSIVRQPRPRPRKRTTPQRIDVGAAEFIHANDPLPVATPPPPVSNEPSSDSKLQGLGPYGTHYTHHFEVFPLNSGVFFHQSTLIGSGTLQSILNSKPLSELMHHRPNISFTLGNHVLNWGSWDTQVSSELGVLLDLIGEQLGSAGIEDGALDIRQATRAPAFLLDYVRKALCFSSIEECKTFVSRLREITSAFIHRVNQLFGSNSTCEAPHLVRLISTCERLVLALYVILQACRNDTTLVGEALQMEEIVVAVAKTVISALLRIGMDPLRDTYHEMRRRHFREQGIKDDKPVIHAWVLLLKVLDGSAIPRSSFWDILESSLAGPGIAKHADAREFELMWHKLFTLLPLCEFSDEGIVVAGRRFQTIADGWGLPQKLIKRVFQLYRENTHQPPSFNGYCRSLVARCHYLAQQWGWKRSTAVIGVIFDFFGSQNLEHLRNEEVYRSPEFLDYLAGEPNLNVEPGDRCFHIFLKLVAVSIRGLQQKKATKDIRNLVARIMPNHDRRYLKEQNIHERDLAALRNHHDLLATLFWASPPDLRPPVVRIQTLIIPADSHKEACLINLRTWNQLARFVVSSGEATTTFKAFGQWRTSFFDQMMQQFEDAALDIGQQFQSLTKEASESITPDIIKAMLSMNKNAVTDVLSKSVMASLDVMRHARDLEAATFAFNPLQIQSILKHFSVCPPELNWSCLAGTLASLDVLLSRVGLFKENEESQQSESQILDSAQADEALLVLDHNIAANFYSMARAVLSNRGMQAMSTSVSEERARCVETTVVLAGRMGARFMEGGLMRLSSMFKSGKYGLFDKPPHQLNLTQRRCLPLFVATLLRHGFSDFHDVDFSLLDIWVLSLVKPHRSLGFENRLALQLIRCHAEFLPDIMSGSTLELDYLNNRGLFESALSFMRQSLRDAGPSLKKTLSAEYSRTLRCAMEQIKSDLHVLVQSPNEHSSYVHFAREIISLVRSHGPENCTIDDFFYQMTKEYSPSMQDPQLQVASLISYGLRLQEEGTRVAYQLFYFLFNNFKCALNNDRLVDESKMLGHGLSSPGFLRFVLGKMMPAIIHAVRINDSAIILLDVYVGALRWRLQESTMACDFSLDDLPHVATLLGQTLHAFHQMRDTGLSLTPSQSYFVRQALTAMNLMWPSFRVHRVTQASTTSWQKTVDQLQKLEQFAGSAENYLSSLVEMDITELRPAPLFASVRDYAIEGGRQDQHIFAFTENISSDMSRNWVVSRGRVFIQAPRNKGHGPGLLTTQGIEAPRLDRRELQMDILMTIQTWRSHWREVFGSGEKIIYPQNLIF